MINSFINALPFEAHVPGYRYCGPGTKLEERLKRGDPGINPLDDACKLHDIAYSKNSDTATRNKADLELADRAWERVKASDASLGERATAYAVTNAMKLKAKLGAGMCKKKTGAGVSKKKTGAGIKKTAVKKTNAGKTRMVRIPKSGGKLEKTLARIGMTAKRVGSVAKKIEKVVGSRGKDVSLGQGLYLSPYPTGYGLYLKPKKK